MWLSHCWEPIWACPASSGTAGEQRQQRELPQQKWNRLTPFPPDRAVTFLGSKLFTFGCCS